MAFLSRSCLTFLTIKMVFCSESTLDPSCQQELSKMVCLLPSPTLTSPILIMHRGVTEVQRQANAPWQNSNIPAYRCGLESAKKL
ncbi:hypothetical protein B0O80DRAFT_438786, partial [Mortierella sp. GBAus27b]